MKENILICSACGSSDVEAQIWVKVNEDNEFVSYVDACDISCFWCNGCNEHTLLKQQKDERTNNIARNS